jgi:uncharacterized protein (TIGR00255 family)
MAVLSGMTGFARAERSGEFGTVGVEARSVNGKGLDARVRLPQGLDRLETEFRNRIKAAFTRGSVAVNLSFERADSAMGLQIDRDLMRRLAEAGRDLVDEGLAAPARVDGLLSVRGVVRSDDGEQSEEIDAAIDAAALDALDAALAGLKDARAEEGAAMGRVLAAQVDEIEALTKKAASHAASQPQAIRDRVKAKFDELLPQGLRRSPRWRSARTCARSWTGWTPMSRPPARCSKPAARRAASSISWPRSSTARPTRCARRRPTGR